MTKLSGVNTKLLLMTWLNLDDLDTLFKHLAAPLVALPNRRLTNLIDERLLRLNFVQELFVDLVCGLNFCKFHFYGGQVVHICR